jgi:hypothetical protein
LQLYWSNLPKTNRAAALIVRKISCHGQRVGYDNTLMVKRGVSLSKDQVHDALSFKVASDVLRRLEEVAKVSVFKDKK